MSSRPRTISKKIYSTYCQQKPLRRLWRNLSPIEFVRFLSYINLSTTQLVIRSTFRQRLPSLASEMAYNSMLGLFPAILAFLTAIGLFSPLKKTFITLAGRLSELAPTGVPELIYGFGNVVTENQSRGLFSVSFAFSLWASAGAMSAAMRALDQMHQIPPRKRRPFWKARLVSIALTLGTIALLITASSLVFVSDWAVQQLVIHSRGNVSLWVSEIWSLFRWPLALGIMSTAFAFVYRFGPSRWNPGKPLMPGAILAALSWAVISGLFRLYVTHFGNFVYSAVATVIVLLLWLWITSLVMLIGDLLNLTVGRAMADSRRQPGR
ncbi:YihY/virulence factor BrkB family protein [Leptolyngbya sp. BC1307]|uniref:YihY/virulence factor BrkB family protein n=1 Tax=Leptolyngbya sp. BC1307 TaxID=2029589 RepID=UPI000EFBBED4|nr:YihY/virulence factor BrkB family protein [Leptolyngbya sp. BC1307]